MNWVQVKIITSKEGIEPVSGMLYELGISGIQISDKEDFKEFLENNRKYWDYVDEELEKLKNQDTTITVYLSDDEEGNESLRQIKEGLKELKKATPDMLGSLELVLENVKDEDWSENWKQYFKPIPVGEKVLIVPEWEEVPETERVVFRINPGMSFGTGSHESTRMCIAGIEKNIKNGDKVLDLGCGSGILSVIALLLGAKEVTAVDIDPMAVDVSFSNLELNGIEKEKMTGYAGDITTDKNLQKILSDEKYDLVIANIVADVIIALSKYVKMFMKEDGYFICSGIINERCDEVVEKLKEAELNILEVKTEGEWSMILCNL